MESSTIKSTCDDAVAAESDVEEENLPTAENRNSSMDNLVLAAVERELEIFPSWFTTCGRNKV